jgi:hypothetical protein
MVTSRARIHHRLPRHAQLHLGIVPVLLGEGVPLFLSGFPQRDFALIENKSYSQGLISLKYKNTRGTPDRKY